MRRNVSLLILFVTAVTTGSAAGPDPKYKAPRTETGQPDLQGVWNFNSDVPLERTVAAEQRVWSREESQAQSTQRAKIFDTIARVAPIEAVGLTWLDNAGRIEDLRTSLITYPDNGRLPKLLEGVRRLPGPEQIFAALSSVQNAPPAALLAALLGGGKKDGPEDLSTSERCLTGGRAPLTPGFDGNYVQIIQSADTVALVTDDETRIVPLDGRPHLSGTLRSWAGDKSALGRGYPRHRNQELQPAHREFCRRGRFVREGRHRAPDSRFQKRPPVRSDDR